MTIFDEQFMLRAVEIAREGMEKAEGGPFGAVVVKGTEIISEGCNQVTSTNDPTAHAEMVALRKACKILNDFQLDGCVLYSSCEPCPMCLGAIYWARPDAVYFANTASEAAEIGFDDAFIYQEIEKSPEERLIPFVHHPNQSAKDLFRAWEQKTDKTAY